MHELALCEGIRTTVEKVAAAHGADRIVLVRLEIGRFAGVEKQALEFAWTVVMHGSVAEGAKLEMIDLPGKAMCYGCAHEVEIAGRLDPCPDCNGGRRLPVGGDELRIKDMEVA